MTNTPLDAPTGFIPAADERPAGQWMEGYWVEIAVWAKRFAYVAWAYFGWTCYLQFKALKGIMIIFDTPVALFGFFCFTFSQSLERAVSGRDQVLLEKSFRELHRFLILGVVLTVLWLGNSAALWHITLEHFSTHSAPHGSFLSE